MSPRRQVRRLGDIALVRVPELVGQHIGEHLRRWGNYCEGIDWNDDQFNRNMAFIKSNVCSCIPAAMYDDFAVNVLKTITQAMEDRGIFDSFLCQILASPSMTIIDQLSTVKPYLGVPRKLMLLVYMNSYKLKRLRNIEIPVQYLINDFLDFQHQVDKYGNLQLTPWLDKCDLRFVEKLKCPRPFLTKKIFSVPENCSKLKVISVYDIPSTCGTNTRLVDILWRFSKLTEVNLRRCSVSDCQIEDLLSYNRHLVKLVLSCQLGYSFQSEPIYPALKHLHMDFNDMDYTDFKTVGTRFPNLTCLKLTIIQR